MLYVLIMYCVGNCPAWLPPPDGALFYSKLADCQAQMAKLSNSSSDPWYGGVADDGERAGPMQYRQTCANMYSESKQLDRIIVPMQLEQLLKDYVADRKAHPVCVLGDNEHCLEHDPPQPGDKCKAQTFCDSGALALPIKSFTMTSYGTCRVGEYAVWRNAKELGCKDPVTKKVRPMCPGAFKGRCATDGKRHDQK